MLFSQTSTQRNPVLTDISTSEPYHEDGGAHGQRSQGELPPDPAARTPRGSQGRGGRPARGPLTEPGGTPRTRAAGRGSGRGARAERTEHGSGPGAAAATQAGPGRAAPRPPCGAGGSAAPQFPYPTAVPPRRRAPARRPRTWRALRHPIGQRRPRVPAPFCARRGGAGGEPPGRGERPLRPQTRRGPAPLSPREASARPAGPGRLCGPGRVPERGIRVGEPPLYFLPSASPAGSVTGGAASPRAAPIAAGAP